jgi:hypothetical protein
MGIKLKYEVDIEFDEGTVVYLKVDVLDSMPGMVIGYEIMNNIIRYIVSWADFTINHRLGIELTEEKPYSV